MNIAQTRHVMAYIWATHPSAPKYTDDDKVRTVASYFRVLYKYAIDDVMEAVDRFCHESPTFIPSAYEIEAKCHKRVDVERYLSDEYRDVERRLEDAEARRLAFVPEYDRAFKERADLFLGKIVELMTDEQKSELAAKAAPLDAVIERYYDLSEECRQIKARKDELYNRASWEAYDAYDRAQAQLAHNDLCSLGFERLALEG